MSRLFKINDLPQYDRFYTNIISDCILSPQLKYLNLYGSDSKKSWDQCLSRMLDEIKTYQNDQWIAVYEKIKERKIIAWINDIDW